MRFFQIIFVLVFSVMLILPEAKADVRWVGCGISKKAYVTKMAVAFEKKYGIKVHIEGGGATKGIRQVAAGKADVGGSCRHLLNVAEEEGVKLHAVGWDAIVAITHKSNPVTDISYDNLKAVFEGKITNWKDLGGSDLPIHVFVRNGKISGVGRMVRELVFREPEQGFPLNASAFKSSGPLEKGVEKDPQAIAFTGISSGRKRNVNFLSLDGHAPSYENISGGSYPFYRPLYLVSGPKTNEDGKKFVKFAKSKDGQAVIKGEMTVTLRDGGKLWSAYRKTMKEARQIGNF